MKNIILISFQLFFFFSIVSSCSRSSNEILTCGNTIFFSTEKSDSDLGIYIFSHPNCGFSRRAIKELTSWASDKPIEIVILDFSGEPTIKENSDKYKKYDVTVQDAKSCNEKLQNFIPRVFFFDKKTNKLIFKLKGWDKTDFPKVERKLKNHLSTP